MEGQAGACLRVRRAALQGAAGVRTAVPSLFRRRSGPRGNCRELAESESAAQRHMRGIAAGHETARSRPDRRHRLGSGAQNDLAQYDIPAMVTAGSFCSSDPAPDSLSQVVSFPPPRAHERRTLTRSASVPAAVASEAMVTQSFIRRILAVGRCEVVGHVRPQRMTSGHPGMIEPGDLG